MRLRQPAGPADATTTPVSCSIQQMVADDVDGVFALYAAYAAEQFGENYSYDRWGPGVPVPYDDIAEARTQEIDPSLAVRARLNLLADSPRGFVLMATREGDLCGFLAASLLPASLIEHELVGRVDDLYVGPQHRRLRIGTELASAAVVKLRRQGALVLRVEFDPAAPGAARFWDAQADWTNDVHTYHSYQ